MMLDDYEVPNKEIKVSMSMRIESETLNGQSSGTSTSHKGFKPKVFNVSLIIPYVEPTALSALIAVAQVTNADGSLKVYDITDDLANAVKVRRVQFTEEFYVREMDRVSAWAVQFSLQDYQSVPEKAEQRQTTAAPQTQTATGNVVAATDDGEAVEGEGEIGFFERQLAKLDRALA
ncbi:baseplate complex protein [Cellvibrio sp. QJXJ]|uniref:baseplate complex protein n=1 Tax=Cellvibrio sp. QJXJ TaxID=2964606 RepID=UPI0021C2E1B7|nr:hypothetical protein [Cellvibrio sp. QJXJ]UUA73110.1 hypothetical protein NNX04_01355 [Cellvibrio sp. QJXJ]